MRLTAASNMRRCRECSGSWLLKVWYTERTDSEPFDQGMIQASLLPSSAQCRTQTASNANLNEYNSPTSGKCRLLGLQRTSHVCTHITTQQRHGGCSLSAANKHAHPGRAESLGASCQNNKPSCALGVRSSLQGNYSHGDNG
jgi:hypothetical protein